MKSCVILYHKNINKIYKPEWINECITSIVNQTYKDYYVYDLNYGNDDFNFKKYFPKKYKFFKEEFKNHVGAMNFLLDECVKKKFDAVFNINLDDYYHEDRFKIQIEKIKEGYDIVSSNFKIIRLNDNSNRFETYEKMIFDKESIVDRFIIGDNIIAHPCVCYSKKFIQNNKYLDEIPEEDFKLWKRTINDYKFYICNEFLLNYRIHSNQITSTNTTNTTNTTKTRTVYNINDNCKYCGFPKNKVKYNFCQKCNKLY